MKTTIKLLLFAICFITADSVRAQVDGIKADPKEKEDVIAGIDMRHWNLSIRAGYSLGGTMPLDMPAALRSIDSFSPKFNYRLGIDIEYRFNTSWGILSGLQMERKGFQGGTSVRGYDVTMRQGQEEVSGPFTGHVVINVVQTGLTIPLQASWYANRKLRVRFGPYLSLLSDKQFNGYAYGEPDSNGNPTAYLRRGGPQGPLVYIGNDETTRGTFSDESFQDYFRTVNVGIDGGVDWFFSRHWGIFGDVSFGLNSVLNGDEGCPVNMELYPIYGTFGVIYKIGR